MTTAILLPASVLVLWSLVMLLWMVVTRLPAASRSGIDITASAGGRGVDLDPQLPPSVAWKSHNFTHLMEQPTLFYATVLILAVIGAGSGLNLALAWAYVAIRILHSLWQAMVNTIPVRLGLYALSTLCLLVLVVNAIRVLLG